VTEDVEAGRQVERGREARGELVEHFADVPPSPRPDGGGSTLRARR
jgi:hypothetical protein